MELGNQKPYLKTANKMNTLDRNMTGNFSFFSRAWSFCLDMVEKLIILQDICSLSFFQANVEDHSKIIYHNVKLSPNFKFHLDSAYIIERAERIIESISQADELVFFVLIVIWEVLFLSLILSILKLPVIKMKNMRHLYLIYNQGEPE